MQSAGVTVSEWTHFGSQQAHETRSFSLKKNSRYIVYFFRIEQIHGLIKNLSWDTVEDNKDNYHEKNEHTFFWQAWVRLLEENSYNGFSNQIVYR